MTVSGKLLVKKSGPFVSIQDWGRVGYQCVGITRGGAMDEHSFAWANKLLGNALNTAVIEITMGPFEAVLESDSILSITGADMDFSIDNVSAESWRTYRLNAGTSLRFTGPKKGLRAYLAIKSGFSAPSIFGSVSTVSREKGVYKQDNQIRAGDILDFPPSHGKDCDSFLQRVPWEFIPDYSESPVLDVITGGQFDLFSLADQKHFFEHVYTVSQDVDRMGYRLSGEALQTGPVGILSEGITRGTIQIPPDGQPILLLNDHQTIGGYAKFGCLTHRSCNRLSQCVPGQDIRFNLIDMEEAQQQRLEFLRFFRSKPTPLA